MNIYNIAFVGFCLVIADCSEEVKAEPKNTCEGGERHDGESTRGVSALQITVSKKKSDNLPEEPFEDEIQQNHVHSPMEVVQAVFPAPAVDTASFLQSETPLVLLETTPAHAFTVILGEEQFTEEKIDEGEYIEQGMPVQFALNSSTQRNGVFYPLGSGGNQQQLVCPSRVMVCNGVVPDSFPKNALIRTGCGCSKGPLLGVPKKVIKVALREGLTDDELESAARQIAHLETKVTNETLLILEKHHEMLDWVWFIVMGLAQVAVTAAVWR